VTLAVVKVVRTLPCCEDCGYCPSADTTRCPRCGDAVTPGETEATLNVRATYRDGSWEIEALTYRMAPSNLLDGAEWPGALTLEEEGRACFALDAAAARI
jgi:hypothetical protein